jgi:hypothetical protein
MKISRGHLLAIAMLLTTFVSFAQEEETEFISPLTEGRSLIGGAFGIILEKEDFELDNLTNPDVMRETTTRASSFSPYYAHFIKDRVLIGGRLIVSTNYDEILDFDEDEREITENTARSYGLGVFTRKYFTLINKFGFYLSPELSYIYQKSNRDFRIRDQQTDNILFESNSETNGDIFEVSTELGLYYVLNNRLSIETRLGGIGYTYTVFNSSNNEESTLRQSASNLALSFTNTLSFNRIFAINYFFK